MPALPRPVRAAALAFALALPGVSAFAQDTGTGASLYDFQASHDGSPPSGGVSMNEFDQPVGVTSADGPAGGGAIFVATHYPGGWGSYVPFTFGADDASGDTPLAAPFALGGRTWLGTTSAGAGHGAGSLWRFHYIEGHLWATRQVLHNFDPVNEGSMPTSNLVGDGHHNFYGTLSDGGPGGAGSVYEIAFHPDDFTWHFRLLHAFTGGADGGHPSGQVAVDRDGVVYGTARDGGAAGAGGVWRIAAHRAMPKFRMLVDLQGDMGASPSAGLVRTPAGELFGTAEGGPNGDGVVFRVRPGAGQAEYTVLHPFKGPVDGSHPGAPLVASRDGTHLYGSTASDGLAGGGTVFALDLQPEGGWTFSTVYSLGARPAMPRGALGLSRDGTTLYGVTAVSSTGQASGSLIQVQLPR